MKYTTDICTEGTWRTCGPLFGLSQSSVLFPSKRSPHNAYWRFFLVGHMVSERCADRLSALSTISSHIHIPLNPNGMALTVSVLASISDIVRSWRTLWLFVFTVFESLDLSAAPENGPAVIFTGHCIHTATYHFSYDRRQSIHYTVRGLISSFSDDRLSSESEYMLDWRILAHSTHISPVKKCVALPRRAVAFPPNFFILLSRIWET